MSQQESTSGPAIAASAVKGKGARDGQAALPGALIESAKDGTAWAYGLFVVL